MPSIVAVTLLAVLAGIAAAAPTIKGVWPRNVSLAGGPHLTIHGIEFPDITAVLLLDSAGVSVTVDTLPCPVDPLRSSREAIVCGPLPPHNETLVDASPKFDALHRIETHLAVVQLTVPVALGSVVPLVLTTSVAYQSAMSPFISEVAHVALPTDVLDFVADVSAPLPHDLAVHVGTAQCDVPGVVGFAARTSPAWSTLHGGVAAVAGHRVGQCRLRNTTAGMYTTTVEALPGGSSTQLGYAVVHPDAVSTVYKPLDDALAAYTTHVFARVDKVEPATISTASTLVTIHGAGFDAAMTEVTLLAPGANGQPTTRCNASATTTADCGNTASSVASQECQLLCITPTMIVVRTPARTLTAIAEGSAQSSVGVIANVSTNAASVTPTMALNGRFTATDEAIAALAADWTVGAALMDLEGRGSNTPTMGVARSVFVPRRTGLYRFLCTATDYVTFTLDGVELCSNEGVASGVAVQRYFASLPVTLINAVNGTAPVRAQTPISTAARLVAGSTHDIVVSYGLARPSSYFSVGMALVPETTTAADLASNFTMPTQLNITVPRDRTFVMGYGLEQVRVPAVPSGQPCSGISVADAMMATFYRFRVRESVFDAPDGSSCSWLVAIDSPSGVPNITFTGATVVQLAAPAEPIEFLFDPIPARMLRIPYSRSAPPLFYSNSVVNATNATTAATTAPSNTSAPTASPVTPVPIVVHVKGELAAHLQYATTATVAQSEAPVVMNETATNATMIVTANDQLFLRSRNSFTTVTRPLTVWLVKAGRDPIVCASATVSLVDPNLAFCTVPTLSGGLYEIVIDVGERGIATASTRFYASQTFYISAVSPATAAWNGGALVTITGTSFPTLVDEIDVTIGDQAATVLYSTPTSMLVRVNAMLSAVPTSGLQLVTVQLYVVAANSSNARGVLATNFTRLPATPRGFTAPVFTFTQNGVPVVASVSPSTGAAASRHVVTVTGRNLAGCGIYLCVVSCVPCTTVWTDATGASVIVETPVADPLTYAVVAVPQSGLGDSNRNVTFTTELAILGVTPRVVSTYGGALMTIAGRGFSRRVSVHVGTTPCDVLTWSATAITCRMQRTQFASGTAMPLNAFVPSGPVASCAVGVCDVLMRSSTLLPTLTAVSPTVGQQSLLTITGLNFAQTETVTVGSAPCVVTSRIAPEDASTSVSTIYCQLARSYDAGRTTVAVDSPPYGVAAPPLPFTFRATVSAVTPKMGSVAGGQLVTVTGEGFGNTTDLRLVGTPCTFGPGVAGTSLSPTRVVCLSGARTTLADAKGAVTMTTNGLTASCCDYTYATARTPIVTRVAPLTGVAGMVVNITGSRLTLETPRISVAGIELPNATMGTLQWSVILPELPALRAPMTLTYADGNAWVSVQEFAVFPFITSISPQWSSYNGGQMITIAGQNFGLFPEDVVRVTVCGHPCAINSSSHREVTCTTPPMYNPKAFAAWPALERAALRRVPLAAYTELILPTAGLAVDGSIATVFDVTRDASTTLFVGVDLGDQLFAQLVTLRILPGPGFESLLLGCVVEISDGAVTWTAVHQIASINSGDGWIVVGLDSASYNARYVRIVAPAATKRLVVAEVEVLGAVSGRTATDTCSVVVFVERPGSQAMSTCTERPSRCLTQPDVVQYLPSFTPTVTQFEPPQVTTGATASVTVFGTTFGIVAGNVNATLDGSVCTLVTASPGVVANDQLVCSVRKPLGEPASPAVAAQYNVTAATVAGSGTRIEVTAKGRAMIDPIPFRFTELWSAAATWRGVASPARGIVVVIPANRTVLLDVSPPPLAALVIAGRLIAKPGVSLTLTTGSVVIEGGEFIVGSFEVPHNAGFNLVLTGTPATLASAVPTFGSKTVALRSGRISMYGPPNAPAMSNLVWPAEPGSSNVTVSGFVSWEVGYQVVVASSSRSAHEAEHRTITSRVTNIDGTTQLWLDRPLAHYHHGGRETFNALTAQVGAEVAVLTRSVTISGDAASSRYMFGAVVQVSPAASGDVLVELSGVEFSRCGQQPGYGPASPARAKACLVVSGPVDLIGSRVRYSSVHHAYAGGFEVINARRMTFDSNSVYDVRGHGFAFLDGAARFHIVKSNIVVLARGVDTGTLHPSCFHITHPAITLESNIAAGCALAGFHYSLAPTASLQNVCPDRAPMGVNSRNVAHSNGQHGMWIPSHVSPAYECGDATLVGAKVTSISRFGAYENADTGLYIGSAGNYLITSAWLFGSGRAGVDVESLLPGLGITLRTSYWLATTSFGQANFTAADTSFGVYGVLAPGSQGVVFSNCSFGMYNDWLRVDRGNESSPAVTMFSVKTCARCNQAGYEDPGGYTYVFSGSAFWQAPNRVHYGEPSVDIVLDLDGTLLNRAGSTNYTALPRFPHIDTLEHCLEPPVLAIIMRSASFPIVICDSDYNFHRVLLAAPKPALLATTNMSLSTTIGTYHAPYRRNARYPEQSGYAFMVPTGTARDELGFPAYDVNMLNFSFSAQGGNDWSSLTVTLDPTQPLVHGMLALNFSYFSTAVRFDVLTRTFAADGALDPLVPGLQTVIPTYYTAPELVATPPTASHCFVDTSTKALLLRLIPGSEPVALQLEQVLCANTGCIFMQPPRIPARTFWWSDVRAWPNGAEPRDGADVIIPPGLTLILDKNTSNLRSLVIQGTLQLHPRLASEINAAYVIIFGGVLSSQASHAPRVLIRLLSNMQTRPYGVDATRILQPGTLLNLGRLDLTSVPRTAQWTTMQGSRVVDESSLTVVDAVDWVRGDVIAVSSGSADATQVDELIVQSVSNGRDVTTVNAFANDHLAETAEITSGLRLQMLSHVGLLSRSIVIEGGADANGVRTGCSIIVGEYGQDAAFAGRGSLDGVEIRYCARPNVSDSAAVLVENVARFSMSISRSSIHHSFAAAVIVNGTTTGALLSQNVLYGSVGSTAVLTASGNRLSRNLAFGTQFPWFARADPATPYALCTYDSRDGVNGFTGNVAAGSESEGFCVQLPDCTVGDADAVADNEAHSNVNGIIVAQKPAAVGTTDLNQGAAAAAAAATPPAYCISTFRAWHNSYIGIHVAVNYNVNMRSPTSHENHIALSTGTNGKSTLTISNAVIGGRKRMAPLASYPCSYFRCSMESITGHCAERAQLLGDAPSKIFGEVGIEMGQYSRVPVTAAYSRDPADLPITKPRIAETPAADAAVYVENVLFANFLAGAELGQCDGAVAIATNPYTLNANIPHFFTNVTWVDVNNLGKAYIHSPSGAWAALAMCGGAACDALNHVAVHDMDGSLLVSSRGGTIVSNYATGALVSCSLVKAWNAYQCLDSAYGQLQLTNLDADASRRAISPLKAQDQNFLARINSALQPPACYDPSCTNLDAPRPGTITTNLRAQRVYLVDFGTEAPRRSQWVYRNCPPGGVAPNAIIARVLLEANMPLTVWANGQFVPTTSVGLTFSSAAGSNYFEALDSRLYVMLPCGSTVEIHQLVSAIITVRIGLVIEDYVRAHAASFAARVAAFMRVAPERIAVLEVYPGSTIVRFRLSSVDSATYNSSVQASEVNSRVINFVSTTLDVLSVQLGVPVLGITDVVWAEAVAGREHPPQFAAGWSLGMILALTFCAVFALGLIVFLIARFYMRVAKYRDYDADITEEATDADLAALTAGDAALAGYGLPREDDGATRVAVGVQSLKIKVDVSDDDEDDAAPLNTHQRQERYQPQTNNNLPAFGRLEQDSDDEFA